MIVHEYLLRNRQKELLAEADRYRLIDQAKQFRSKKGGFYRKFLAWLGGILCNLGGQLEKRFGDEVTMHHSQSIDRSLEV